MKENFILLSLIFILFACKKEENPPAIYMDSGRIGSTGGIIKTDDGASVEIPFGALSTDEEITITNISKNYNNINSGNSVYELGPDRLTFLDSIIISLPFDSTYIDYNILEKGIGVGISVLQDSGWVKLETTIDMEHMVAKAKTVHFSKYKVTYPSELSKYFLENMDSNPNTLKVPYYYQYASGWCFYYALNMITKYAGYNYKAPYFASMMGETDISEGYKNWIGLFGDTMYELVDSFPDQLEICKQLGVNITETFISFE